MYYGARYYHPVLGRFVSVDPVVRENVGRREFQLALVLPQKHNGYTYTLNNPLKYTDPNGECEAICLTLLSLAIVYAPMIPAYLDDPLKTLQSALTAGPVTGETIDAYELATGTDFWTGEQIGGFWRVMTGVGVLTPIVPASWFRKGGSQIAKYFRKIQTVEWKRYVEHIAPKNVPWKKIVEGTTSGVAKYSPDINIESLERFVWENGTQTTNGRNWKVMEFDEVVGASAGKEVRWVRVEESAGTIHGHPIIHEDFKKYTK